MSGVEELDQLAATIKALLAKVEDQVSFCLLATLTLRSPPLLVLLPAESSHGEGAGPNS